VKKFMSGLAAGFLLWAAVVAATPAEAYDASETSSSFSPLIKIQLDGYRFPTNPEPINYNNHTLVPFRSLAQALGLQVSFDANTDTILAENKSVQIKMVLNQHTAYINEQPVQLDVEPILYENRTMIPARFLCEAVGANVTWDANNATVVVKSQERDMDTLVFYGLGSYDNRAYMPYFRNASFTWSRLDADGKLVTNQSEYQWPTDGANDLLHDVKQAQVGTSLMVFSENANGELTKLLADPTKQQAFADSLAAKLAEQDLNGAVLDFETLGKDGDNIPAVQQQYNLFVKKVADTLHAQNRKLTVVVSPLNGAYKGYDYKGLAASADQLYVMAYSYIDDKLPQPNDKVDEALQLALKEVDAGKITLGISVFSETPETVQEKIGLAKRYNVHGVGFWILRLFDDSFLKGIDQSLVLRGEHR
jgi:spore germination protein YaaH